MVEARARVGAGERRDIDKDGGAWMMREQNEEGEMVEQWQERGGGVVGMGAI